MISWGPTKYRHKRDQDFVRSDKIESLPLFPERTPDHVLGGTVVLDEVEHRRREPIQAHSPVAEKRNGLEEDLGQDDGRTDV
ncbi:MAG: hypothetical protein NTW38_05325 [Candidatus Aminicenantes bacterium]|nr:hypothetical protein [Candidatus Aminicenantes bacterium]